MTAARLPRVDASAAHQLVRAGFAWWRAELLACLPLVLRRQFEGGKELGSVIDVAPAQAVLGLPGRGRSAPISFPLDDATRRDELQAALRRQPSRAVTIRLDASLLLQVGLDLPASAERTLRPIIQHQLSRIVPLDPKLVCFDAHIRQRQGNALKVDLVVAKNATVEDALQLARSAGLLPKSVIQLQPADMPGKGMRTTFTLWRAGDDRMGGGNRARRVLEAATIVLALAAYGMHVHRLDQLRGSLRSQVAAARQGAAAAQDMARKVGEMGEISALLVGRRQAPSPLDILDELTRLVPTDGWVSQLSMHEHTVMVSGYARQATGLIATLEGSAMLGNPRFQAPITLGPDGKGERFDLAVDVKDVARQ